MRSAPILMKILPFLPISQPKERRPLPFLSMGGGGFIGALKFYLLPCCGPYFQWFGGGLRTVKLEDQNGVSRRCGRSVRAAPPPSVLALPVAEPSAALGKWFSLVCITARWKGEKNSTLRNRCTSSVRMCFPPRCSGILPETSQFGQNQCRQWGAGGAGRALSPALSASGERAGWRWRACTCCPYPCAGLPVLLQQEPSFFKFRCSWARPGRQLRPGRGRRSRGRTAGTALGSPLHGTTGPVQARPPGRSLAAVPAAPGRGSRAAAPCRAAPGGSRRRGR